MTYPEIVYQHLQNIIQYKIDDATREKMVRSPQWKRICHPSRCGKRALAF